MRLFVTGRIITQYEFPAKSRDSRKKRRYLPKPIPRCNSTQN